MPISAVVADRPYYVLMDENHPIGPQVVRLHAGIECYPIYGFSDREGVMSEKKPTPIIVERNISICPVCGKRSYSRGGIHPQCAMIQADAPRNLRLAAEKKAKAKERLRTLA